ncbi:MAG: hypothetical protein JO234_04860 [Hyphomicrobiales bacterium]|nr:hypothetical protein [Hyphomicrobiales bacterium]
MAPKGVSDVTRHVRARISEEFQPFAIEHLGIHSEYRWQRLNHCLPVLFMYCGAGVIAMKHFVRFAKLSASGRISPRGWRVRLFATANDASAFAQGMIGNGWRAELGDVGDLEAAAPNPKAPNEASPTN